ncbi:MAG: orotidine-5'-phosphate decarboxylase [Maricaulaceae bacterium]
MSAFTPDRLFVALDVPSVDEARTLAQTLLPTGVAFKIGLQLLPIGGLELARELKDQGATVFLDYKLLDIANTVESAVRSVASLGVDYLTVHCEPQAVSAAVRGAKDTGLKLLGVTVLTSYTDKDVQLAGYAHRVNVLVMRKAMNAMTAGFTGVVAAPREIPMLRERLGQELEIVTPGIRPAGANADDQARIATPDSAVKLGATRLVIGRPITQAPDPVAATQAIIANVAG